MRDLECGYATTAHKSIGSEWERVYCVFHHRHMGMMNRELLYTAVTRAKLFLQVIYDGQDLANRAKLNTSVLEKAIVTPFIKGVTVQEKIDYLERKDKLENEDTSNLLDKFKKKETA